MSVFTPAKNTAKGKLGDRGAARQRSTFKSGRNSLETQEMLTGYLNLINAKVLREQQRPENRSSIDSSESCESQLSAADTKSEEDLLAFVEIQLADADEILALEDDADYGDEIALTQDQMVKLVQVRKNIQDVIEGLQNLKTTTEAVQRRIKSVHSSQMLVSTSVGAVQSDAEDQRAVVTEHETEMERLAERQAEIQRKKAEIQRKKEELDKEQEEIDQKKLQSSLQLTRKMHDSARKISESAGNALRANRAGIFINEENETEIQIAVESVSKMIVFAKSADSVTGAMIDGKGTAQHKQSQYSILKPMFDFLNGEFSHEEQQAFFNGEDSQGRKIKKALDECLNGLELHSVVSVAKVCLVLYKQNISKYKD